MPEPLSIGNGPGGPEYALTELLSVDSTNNYALSRIHAGLAQSGAAIFAHQQVAGKGQRGKTWVSQPDESLSLSLILDPSPLTVPRQFELSALVAVTVCNMLNQMIPDEFRIKWPNDIYWQDRKAVGILIESVIGGPGADPAVPAIAPGISWKWAVAGIGINVNQAAFDPAIRHPVSLRMITGKKRDPLQLAKILHSRLMEAWADMKLSGFDPVYERFCTLLYKRDQPMRFRKQNRTFQAVIRRVTREGLLVLDHGLEEEFRVGELEFIFD